MRGWGRWIRVHTLTRTSQDGRLRRIFLFETVGDTGTRNNEGFLPGGRDICNETAAVRTNGVDARWPSSVEQEATVHQAPGNG